MSGRCSQWQSPSKMRARAPFEASSMSAALVRHVPDSGWMHSHAGAAVVDAYRRDVAATIARDGAAYVVTSFATPIGWQRADGSWTVPSISYSNYSARHQSRARDGLGVWGSAAGDFASEQRHRGIRPSTLARYQTRNAGAVALAQTFEREARAFDWAPLEQLERATRELTSQARARGVRAFTVRAFERVYGPLPLYRVTGAPESWARLPWARLARFEQSLRRTGVTPATLALFERGAGNLATFGRMPWRELTSAHRRMRAAGVTRDTVEQLETLSGSKLESYGAAWLSDLEQLARRMREDRAGAVARELFTMTRPYAWGAVTFDWTEFDELESVARGVSRAAFKLASAWFPARVSARVVRAEGWRALPWAELEQLETMRADGVPDDWARSFLSSLAD